MPDQPPGTVPSSRVSLAVGTIGFALGGFFDGILLHQVLQWHHFLSLVGGDALRDIRAQILADGLFHVAVYVIALVGLWLLWRARSGLAGAAGVRLFAMALLGFGIWQLIDVVGFHWIVGIHRIRVDVPNPLAWDLGWIAVIGLPPLLVALLLLRRRNNDAGPPHPGRGGVATAAMLALAILAAAPVAALPPAKVTTALVLFRPGLGLDGAFAAVAAAEGRVVWAAASGEIVAIDLGTEGSAWPLYRRGALLVGTGLPVANCLSWLQIRGERAL